MAIRRWYLAIFFSKVFAIERDVHLFQKTVERLQTLEARVHLRHGDGHQGWAEHGPYDAIVVSCALHLHHPDQPGFEDSLRPLLAPLFAQLSPLSCLVIPAGDAHEQRLCFFRRKHRDWDMVFDWPVRFVPLLAGVS